MAELDIEPDENIEDDVLDTDVESDAENEAEEDHEIEAEPKSGLLSGRRLLIIVGIIGAVFVIGAALFGIRMFTDSTPKMRGAQFSVPLDRAGESSQKKQKKSKKKKKKIKYVELFAQVTGTQAANVLRQLSLADISFSQAQSGKNFKILVDEDRLEEAKNILAIRGLPSGGSKGYELLDDAQTLGVTEFDKRIRYLRALSGELEKAVMQFEQVETSKVQVVLPEQRLFAVTQPPVTASILIRKMPGAIVTDDVVFSIIQLVANAVENLQPENVSVIDTEGKVLSAGIFERMAARAAGLLKDEQNKKEQDSQMAQIGQPIVPNFKDMKNWYEIKRKYERALEDKAIKQLIGVLPIGSFKLAITADLGAVSEGEVVDVKRLTTSIVVDNNNEDIFLDQDLKKQIFPTVAGAIGYVRGRDTIQLSKADFILFTDAERKRMEKLMGRKKRFPFGKILLWLGLAGGVFYGIKKWKNREQSATFPLLSDEEDEVDFSDLNDDSASASVEEIKDIARSNPEFLGEIMEEWLTS
jgi:flagellar biosynthesis/type III secretory pathway M-ring protein FliF/YscJ